MKTLDKVLVVGGVGLGLGLVYAIYELLEGLQTAAKSVKDSGAVQAVIGTAQAAQIVTQALAVKDSSDATAVANAASSWADDHPVLNKLGNFLSGSGYFPGLTALDQAIAAAGTDPDPVQAQDPQASSSSSDNQSIDPSTLQSSTINSDPGLAGGSPAGAGG